MTAFIYKWRLWIAMAALLIAFWTVKASRAGRDNDLLDELRDRLRDRIGEERERKSAEAEEKYHDTVDSGLADWIDGMLG